MSLNFLKNFYEHVRDTMVWFVVYFILQTIIWVALAILIWLYPQALFILFSLFFLILAVLSIYFAVLIGRYALKLKKIKDMLSGDFS